MPALIHAFLDEASSTYTYVVYETDGGPCAIVDSVLNYDPASGRTDTAQADNVIAFVREHGLQVQWLTTPDLDLVGSLRSYLRGLLTVPL